MRFAKHELAEVDRYTPERAALVLSDLGSDTLAYIDALRLIAKDNAATASRKPVESK